MSVLLVGGLVGSLAAAEVGPSPAEGLERAISLAEARLQAGEFPAAERHYREALFEGWLLMGTLERLDGRLPEARDALRTAADFVADRRTGLLALARAYVQLDEAERAAAILADLAGKDPRDVETRRLLARVLAADGKPEQAVARLDEAVAASRDDPEAVFLLATEYLWLKEVKPAERLFADVVRSRPIPQTRVLIGRAYRDAGEYARARAELQAALGQDPAVRRAHYYLGMVALADAKTAEPLRLAEAEFREELRLAPKDPLTNDQLGLALLDAARPADALPYFETAVQGDGARSLFLHHLGRCQLALDRPADAVASLRRALELAGEQGASEAEREPIHYQLGQALRRIGAREEAAEQLGEAGRLAAKRRDASATTSRQRAEVGDTPFADAVSFAGMAPQERLELRRRATGGLARAYFNLGVLQAQTPGTEAPAERYARAAALLEKAASLDPDFPQVQSSLGVAYFNARQFQAATLPLSRALAAQPQDEGLKRMLATACVNTQSWEQAVALLHDDPGRQTDASLQFAYGLALLRSGRATEAEPILADLVARLGDSADLRLLLAEARAAQSPQRREHDP